MFGAILTVAYKKDGITSQNIEGFPTRRDIDAFIKNWETPFHPEWTTSADCHTARDYATYATVYEIPDERQPFGIPDGPTIPESKDAPATTHHDLHVKL